MSPRPGNDLVRSSLDLVILAVLGEEPLYGYLIQKKIGLASGGRIQPPAGTLYPLLHRLEADGLIRSRWDPADGRRRKWYQLTPKGRRQLQQQARDWQQLAACLNQLLGTFAKLNAEPN